MLFLAVGAVLAPAIFPGLARAGDGPSAPPVISLSAKKGAGKYNLDNKSTVNQGNGTTGGDDKNHRTMTATSSDSKTKAWVDITVRNSGNGAAKGLVINYSLYVQTSTAGHDGSSITWSKTDGSETLDELGAGKTTLVQTSTVDKDTSISVSTTNGDGKKHAGSTTGSVTNTDIMGWYIEAVLDGKTVFKREEPNGIKKKAEASM